MYLFCHQQPIIWILSRRMDVWNSATLCCSLQCWEAQNKNLPNCIKKKEKKNIWVTKAPLLSPSSAVYHQSWSQPETLLWGDVSAGQGSQQAHGNPNAPLASISPPDAHNFPPKLSANQGIHCYDLHKSSLYDLIEMIASEAFLCHLFE